MVVSPFHNADEGGRSTRRTETVMVTLKAGDFYLNVGTPILGGSFIFCACSYLKDESLA